MHREIARRAGICLRGDVDHWNGDGLDNRRRNLRAATPSQNQHNRRKRLGCSSRFKGVHWHKRHGKWAAKIRIDGRQLHLGYFPVERDAAAAYNLAANQEFGEFALTNEIV